jgi:hypothetical protein
VDQCKSLLHAGLVAVGYGAVGFKLLAQSAEAVAQRVLARRGCLLKVWAGGARQRAACLVTSRCLVFLFCLGSRVLPRFLGLTLIYFCKCVWLTALSLVCFLF